MKKMKIVELKYITHNGGVDVGGTADHIVCVQRFPDREPLVWGLQGRSCVRKHTYLTHWCM